MFGFDEARQQRDELYSGDPHKAKFSHEALAGGVAFEAMKKWEDHQRSKGVAVNHTMAKEALMGLVGAEMDKWAETKGMSKVDRERAKHQAEEQADHFYNNQYGDQDQFNPNQTSRHRSMDY